MAAQRAFVATAHPESPLGQVAARSGGGVCVSGGNVEALADSVESLLSNAEHRMAMAAAGRRFVEREADREVVCRRLLLLLVPGSTQAGPGRSFVSPESSGIGF
jgi:glycosyltransferase involved in cell wall biosynthesis